MESHSGLIERKLEPNNLVTSGITGLWRPRPRSNQCGNSFGLGLITGYIIDTKEIFEENYEITRVELSCHFVLSYLTRNLEHPSLPEESSLKRSINYRRMGSQRFFQDNSMKDQD